MVNKRTAHAQVKCYKTLLPDYLSYKQLDKLLHWFLRHDHKTIWAVTRENVPPDMCAVWSVFVVRMKELGYPKMRLVNIQPWSDYAINDLPPRL